jgi:hypothetical protein
VADVVSALPGVGRGQRPRLHRASSCAGTGRARLGVDRRGGAPADPPPPVAELLATMKIAILDDYHDTLRTLDCIKRL